MSLFQTFRQNIIAEFPNAFNTDAHRYTRYGMLNLVNEMSYTTNEMGVMTPAPNSLISEDLRAKAMMSQGTPLQIPVTSAGLVTVKNVRSCDISGGENDSDFIDVTWTTYVVDITVNAAMYKKNYITYLADLRDKINAAENALALSIEDSIYAKLDADKSVVYDSTLVGTGNKYPLVGNTVQVDATQQPLFFNDLPAIFEADNFYSLPYYIIGSTNLQPSVRQYQNQGVGNSSNTAFQFDYQNYAWRFSNRMVTGSGKLASFFAMTPGSIGIMSRLDVDSDMGHSSTDGTQWGSYFSPLLGMTIGTQYKSTCTDMSIVSPELAHLKSSLIEHWQLSVDVALVTRYNKDSATISGAIKKIDYEI